MGLMCEEAVKELSVLSTSELVTLVPEVVRAASVSVVDGGRIVGAVDGDLNGAGAINGGDVERFRSRIAVEGEDWR